MSYFCKAQSWGQVGETQTRETKQKKAKLVPPFPKAFPVKNTNRNPTSEQLNLPAQFACPVRILGKTRVSSLPSYSPFFLSFVHFRAVRGVLAWGMAVTEGQEAGICCSLLISEESL